MNKLTLNPSNSSKSWHDQLLSMLLEQGIDFTRLDGSEHQLLQMENVILNLIDLSNNYSPHQLIMLQSKYAEKDIKFIHLWEDVWLTKSDQVIARLKSILGLNAKIYGRQTKVGKLAKPIAASFINSNHLQGYVSSRYKFGLFHKNELVAVATFSALRKMNHTQNYKSAELIRFAVKAGCSICGGLSKLISAFRDAHQPNDLMTYADRDWSAGEAYLKLGFEKTTSIHPQAFTVDSEYQRQLKKDDESNDGLQVFNTGSLKYILKF